MDDLAAALPRFHHPLETDRVLLRHRGPMIMMASESASEVSAVVAPPRPTVVPRPGTVELCQIRAWLLTQTKPRPPLNNFLIR